MVMVMVIIAVTKRTATHRTAWYDMAWYGMRDTEYNTVHCRALYSMQMSVEERDRGRE
jgi:hypothetical protein